jgi:hypothetical protein
MKYYKRFDALNFVQVTKYEELFIKSLYFSANS